MLATGRKAVNRAPCAIRSECNQACGRSSDHPRGRARDSSPPRLLAPGGGDYLWTPPRELGMTNVTGLPTTPNLSENIDCCKDRECIGGASLPRRFAP